MALSRPEVAENLASDFLLILGARVWLLKLHFFVSD
jgi:hypothetical protein